VVPGDVAFGRSSWHRSNTRPIKLDIRSPSRDMPPVKTPGQSFWPRLARNSARTLQRRAGLSLYEAIVAQARSEVFYRDHGVPDTVNGRFEMIVLHAVLVVARLQAEGEEGRELARGMLEAFVADVDDACRRLGIGDMGVPRHVKKATAAVLERGTIYRAAMAAPRSPVDDPLARAVGAHAWGEPLPDDPAGRQALADYVRRAVASLDAQRGERIVAGAVSFPTALKD
jgi:cytochrome b pre-mRNA-processing protein 3